MYSVLHNAYGKAREEELSWVCWRLPDDGQYQQLGPVKAGLWDGTIPGEKAFVFAPFDNRDFPALILGDNVHAAPVSFKRHLPAGQAKKDYLGWVNTCLKEIRGGRFSKLVGARVHEEKQTGFDAVAHFLTLSEKYPAAFCYLFYSPFSGTWLGATPELFLDFSIDNITTVALAGTQPAYQPAFGRKEEEEQQLVVEYVRNALQPFTKEVQVSQRNRTPSGHLLHLVNRVSGVPLKGLEEVPDIIRALHPTPAVAGIPKEEAVDFIRANEGFDRAYYSGFLGPVEKEKGKLFVNLRCMQVEDDRQFYYVGAGLTALSDAEKEWQETEEKRKVIAPL